METFFPGFTTLQLCDRINDLLSDLGDGTRNFPQEEFYSCQCSMTSLVTEKATKKNVWQMPGVVKVLARKFGIGQWSFIGPGSEKKWYSAENSPQGAWDHIADAIAVGICRKRAAYFPCNDSSPGEISKARDRKNCQYTSLQMILQLTQFFALSFLPISSVSTEQCRTYVKNLKLIKMDQVNLSY